MAGLDYTQNSQINIPIVSKDISPDTSDYDPLAPTDLSAESGLTNNFNAQSGLYVGPQNDVGAYAGLGWGGNIDMQTPADGQSGILADLSFSATTGVKLGASSGGVVGFVQGGFSYTQGLATWSPAETDSFEMDVYDDEGNVVGSETVTNEYPGFHRLDEEATLLNIRGAAYGDTNGFAGVDTNIEVTRLNGEGLAIGGGVYGGFNNEDGGTACLYGDASKAISDNWSAYGHGQVCGGYEESGVEAGIRGTLSLTDGGLFDRVPVSVGVGLDEGSDSPEIRASVIGFQF